ncbi:MAG: isopeptide-forming domain-containing fimbrial protein [Clostridiales bacterium]|nr:isopeptide-forming domain-containing fimbrial protein [Clostridiales bacterium]
MSKVKRILAMLMAMVMIMGLTITASAAVKETATITVNNATNATFLYVQVISPDRTTETGWTFTSKPIENAYTTAFEMTDPQKVIQDMIEKPDGNTEKVSKALSNVMSITSSVLTEMANPQTVSSAGVYAIKASEVGYTYNNMAAYVGFGEVQGYEYPSLLDATLDAKKTPTTIEKVDTDTNKVVAIGDTVTYTITTKVPFIDPNSVDKTFKITDEITGAEYLDFTTGDNFSVTMDGRPVSVEGNIIKETEKEGFVLDLSSLITENNYNADREIVVTYKAKVTAVTVDNKAGSHVSGEEVDSDSDKIYTGSIALTKYANDETTETKEDNEKLAGAGFIVTKEGSTDALKFVQVTEGTYKYAPEATEGVVTEVFTGPDGTLVVKGLDIGEYEFTEQTAPKGYSINETPAKAELKITNENGVNGVANQIITAETDIMDTKLSSLPSTGGIGTTIFTIGGCVIMIVAAGLFFASRKKEAK